MALTLRAAVTATQTTIDVLGTDELEEGDLKTVDSECIEVRTAARITDPGVSGQRVSVYRGREGTRKAAHAAEASVSAYSAAGVGDFLGLSLSGDAPAGPQTLYVGPDDPGAVGAGAVWIDTSDGPPFTQWVRNGDDDGWGAPSMVVYSGGEVVAGVTLRAATPQVEVIVGDPDNSDGWRLTVPQDGNIVLGNPTVSLELGTDGSVLLIGGGGGLEIFPDGTVALPLPTDNPNIAGRLWNDNGTVKVSAGA